MGRVVEEEDKEGRAVDRSSLATSVLRLPASPPPPHRKPEREDSLFLAALLLDWGSGWRSDSRRHSMLQRGLQKRFAVQGNSS